jgi:dihydroorotate dehydrogenase (fumarate)
LINLESLVIGNGAGAVKTTSDVEAACKSAATRITVGSVTKEKRGGNLGETYYYSALDGWSLNSLGLPNMGMEEYCDHLGRMVNLAREYQKELCVSIAGFTPDEYASMAACCFYYTHSVELNLSCPNVWGDSGLKSVPAFDYEALGRIYTAVAKAIPKNGQRYHIIAKASPTDDEEQMKAFAYATNKSGIVDEVVAFNSEGGVSRKRGDGREALVFRPEIHAEIQHKGGLAGSALIDKTPQRIKMLRGMLDDYISITALGGISNATHAFKNLQAGARGFMCTTAYMEMSPRVLSHILEGLVEMLPDAA